PAGAGGTGFVPADLDASTFEAVSPLVTALLDRPVKTLAQYETWLLDRSELDAACSESRANLYIAMTCDTGDKAKAEAYRAYIENVAPKLEPLKYELDERQAGLAKLYGGPMVAPGGRLEVVTRDVTADVEMFRAENVPLNTQLETLGQKYQTLIGAMSVEFDGQERTLPQMARYQEVTDRSVREAAWRGVAERRLQDREAIDEIYDKQIALRDKVAKNAGFKDFVGYAYKEKHRFDYAPEDCFKFHEAVAKVVTPFNRRLDEKRKKQMGLTSLRPWDLAVDPKGRGPLRPFEGGRDLVSRSRKVFAKMDARLAMMFERLGDGSNTRGPEGGESLDLDSRKGKAPGGYQYMRDRRRQPFIFMNAAGLHRDVETMVHEAGHAFHSMLCESEPLVHYRHSPIEFAEVASMSMELLSMRHWGGDGSFYAGAADLARAQRKQLEGSVSLLAWIATIDAFQHWVYSNPGHTRAEREAFWLELDRKFGGDVEWIGLDPFRRSVWHRQPHLFLHPFYYIEYGIAQLGSLQLWLMGLEKGEDAAIEAYIRGLSLGGSRPLPELFRASGLAFDFGEGMFRKIVERVERELEKLPE
ncbi:MAG: M3 family oligoendopeptidase, partial [Phycisphaerales bacterium]|nr:M3 family oligoendopeptidase [Phycisphaerales bacterium]